MDKRWVTVIIAGIMEIIWAISMNHSNGFTIWHFNIIVIVFLILSTVLLSKSLKSGIPSGAVYAVWTGIGTVGTTIISVLLKIETVTILRLIFIVLIIAGITGLYAVSSEQSAA